VTEPNSNRVRYIAIQNQSIRGVVSHFDIEFLLARITEQQGEIERWKEALRSANRLVEPGAELEGK